MGYKIETHTLMFQNPPPHDTEEEESRNTVMDGDGLISAVKVLVRENPNNLMVDLGNEKHC